MLAGSQIAPFDSGDVSSVRRCGRIGIKTSPGVNPRNQERQFARFTTTIKSFGNAMSCFKESRDGWLLSWKPDKGSVNGSVNLTDPFSRILWFVQYLLDHYGGRAVLCGSGQVTPTANEGTWESAWNRIVVEQSLTYGRLGSLNCASRCVEICSQSSWRGFRSNRSRG
jgi:hypothetical protein